MTNITLRFSYFFYSTASTTYYDVPYNKFLNFFHEAKNSLIRMNKKYTSSIVYFTVVVRNIFTSKIEI